MRVWKNFGIPHVVVRPGSVYGERNPEITGRVGLGTFGLFLHLGGSNTVPFTYVENCAEAIALAGLVKGVDGEVFNVVDDDLPSSRQFLRQYKKNVRQLQISLRTSRLQSCALLFVGEVFAMVTGTIAARLQSETLERRMEEDGIHNEKLKTRLGWAPMVSTAEALRRLFRRVARRVGGMLKVGIVGCGKIADAHASQIQRVGGCEIVGVCDREPLMAKQLYERFPVKQYFSRLALNCGEARPDVVHITTPPESHFDIARFCLEHDCHVYVEKPFTLDASASSVHLSTWPTTKGLKLTVGHNYQFSHAARRMRALGRKWLPGRPSRTHGELLRI